VRLQSDDAEIFYEVIGDGPPVVLLHPFPAHHGVWLPAAGFFSARYRVVLPDLRGHGESTPGTGAATMEKHANDTVRSATSLASARQFLRESRSVVTCCLSSGDGFVIACMR
jgi:3-oxoadipate enol-lactonase